MPFDRVSLVDEAGTARDVELDEFLDMPLQARIQTILERRVRFFSGAREIKALRALRALSGGSH